MSCDLVSFYSKENGIDQLQGLFHTVVEIRIMKNQSLLRCQQYSMRRRRKKVCDSLVRFIILYMV